MDLGKTLYVCTFDDWYAWLKKNHLSEKEIWLVYYKKSSGKPRISYNDAVDGALCFGWIDSILKKIGDVSFAQRFSPRRKNSVLSELNKERVRRLVKSKKMTPRGLDSINHVFDSKKDSKEKFVVPKKILSEIKKNPDAWKNFQKLPLGYKRIRIGYILSQGEGGEKLFKKSLDYFIKMTAKNKRFGFVRD